MESLKANTRQTREFIIDCITAGGGSKPVVPFVQSSPGMGKSAIVKSIADEYGMEIIDHRLSTSAPEDLTGLPRFREMKNEDGSHHRTVAEFAPFEMFPIKGDNLPKGKNGWLLFLDEFNSGTKMVQAAAYKLILDRYVGQNPLHERVLIVTAGNLATDRAIVNPLSTAMQSRVIHLEMELVHSIFMKDVALKYNWDPRIIAFLSFNKDRLYDFRPEHNNKTFCCPRTWEFMNNLIDGKDFNLIDNPENPSGDRIYEMDHKAPLYSGAITAGVATEFIQFTKVYLNIPKLQDILADPTGLPIPNERGMQFALVTSLMQKSDKDNFEKITQYVNRFSSEFRILFFRGLITRNPALKAMEPFRKAMLELSRWLHD